MIKEGLLLLPARVLSGFTDFKEVKRILIGFIVLFLINYKILNIMTTIIRLPVQIFTNLYHPTRLRTLRVFAGTAGSLI